MCLILLERILNNNNKFKRKQVKKTFFNPAENTGFVRDRVSEVKQTKQTTVSSSNKGDKGLVKGTQGIY